MWRQARLKLFNTLLSLTAITLNLLNPFVLAFSAYASVPVAYAEEQIVEPSSEPSPEPSSLPSTEPTAEPSSDPSPEPSVSPEPEVSPAPSPSVAPSTEPSPEPSSEPSPEPTAEPVVEVQVVEPTPEPSLAPDFDLSVIEPSSAMLSTNKADYTPNEQVVISASQLLPTTTYEITISSTDPPAVTHTDLVSSDDTGTFSYTYQLDGTYRPNYSVSLYLAGILVASTTFTDSPICQNDVNGANDYSGQQDLTRMCGDYASLPATLQIDWNWDEIAWTGSNSGDACALFDTDDDGNVNYSLCVTVKGDPATYFASRLYSCGDDKTDRCTNPISQLNPSSDTSCSVSQVNSDPFPSGAYSPVDTNASCSVKMTDISATSAKLLDVCAYPSQEPNSNPFDCIVATSAATGRIEVVKNLIPSDDTGRFDLSIVGVTTVTNQGDGGTTGEQVVLTDKVSGTDYTFSESGYGSTSLSDYSTSVECKDNNGTGSIVPTTGTNPWTVNVGKDDDIVCTITNTLQLATITLQKTVINNYGGTAVANNFQAYLDGTPYAWNTPIPVDAGTYTASESVVTGYSPSDWGGDCAANGSVTVAPGGSATCTITNSDVQPLLTVTKIVVNDDGGTLGVSDFPLFVDATQVTSGVQNGFDAGTYTVSETIDSGYTSTIGGDCAPDGSVTLNVGDTKSCTITNDDKAAYLIIDKTVINDNGGNAVANDFALTIDSQIVLDEAVIQVNPGSHTVGETNLPGYTASAWGEDCDAQGNVSVALGETKTCTITNDDQPGTLIVNKEFVGETGDPTLFSYQVNGGNSIDFEADASNSHTVNAGSYTVLENNPGPSYSVSYNNCSVQVDIGETEACTITNTRLPTLTVNKILSSNASIGTENGLFNLRIDDVTQASNIGDGGTTGPVIVSIGAHTASETAGTNTSLSDYDSSFSGDCDITGDVVLAAGENKICTITNIRKTGKILIDKLIYQGPATESDWSFSLLGQTFHDGDFVILPLGTYDITESDDVEGYSLDSVLGACDNLRGQTADLNVSQTLGDDHLTCTFINTRDTGSVVAHKWVDRDNDGTYDSYDPQDFTWALDAGSNTAMGTVINNVPTSTNAISHSVTESVAPGYRLVGYYYGDGSCDNLDGFTQPVPVTVNQSETTSVTFCNTRETGTIIVHKDVEGPNGEDIFDNSQDFGITLDGGNAQSITDGETVTYNNIPTGPHVVNEPVIPSGYSLFSILPTNFDLEYNETEHVYIVNRQNNAGLTLVKTVVNDNGGTLTQADFPVFIDGNPAVWGSNIVAPGTYQASETPQTGYTASDWSGHCDAQGNVTLNPGESKTCYITNDDNAPSLTLQKVVRNLSGGNQVAADWTLTATGPSSFSGQGPTVQNGVSFDSGTYDLSESGPGGYTASSWVCVGVTQDDSDTIYLALGESATCTITNTDIAPSLTLIKNVVNNDGGNANPDDFLLTVAGNNVLSGVKNTYNANAPLALNETVLPGYQFVSLTGHAKCPTVLGGTITLDEGEDVTCTITNDDQQAYITVTKVVTNDNGGNAAPDDFALTLEGSPVLSGVAVPVDPGTYTAGETLLAGYTFEGYSGDCDQNGDLTIALGESKTCTLTNNDQQAFIIVDKTVINDNGGSALPNDFLLTVNGNAVLDEVAYPVNPGSYVVGETLLPGYVAGNWGADCDLRGGVSVALGETKTCTITNDDQQAYITVTKVVTNDNGGNAAPDDFNLSLGGNSVLSGVANPVNPGTYTAGETLLAGYTFEGYSGNCDQNGDITVALGESKTCTITNDDIAPTITLSKNVLVGGADVNDFGLTIGATPVSSGETLAVQANTAYSLNETGLPGYSFVNLTGDAKCPAVLGGTATLDEGEDLSCTITNTRDTGDLLVTKIIDIDGDLSTTGDQSPAADWEFSVEGQGDDLSSPDNQLTNSQGQTLFADLYTGTYDVAETLQPGFDFVDATCGNVVDGPTAFSVEVVKGETTECTFYNTPNGRVHGYKWNDINGNSQDDQEDKLSGWTIELYLSNGEGYDLVDSFVTDSSEEHLGWYWFEHLFPGDYRVCEVLQDGWTQTYPLDPACHEFSLPLGQTLVRFSENAVFAAEYNFGNRANPELTISKSNNAGGSVGTGATITFTLTVKLTGSNLYDVQVVDLPADGFVYQPGSWHATKNGSDFAVEEPSYASPGTWNLGDLVPGDELVLTYDAVVASDVTPGTYKDLALAFGCLFATRNCAVNDDNVLLAEGINSTFVDGNFVGTNVVVDKDARDTGNVELTEEGQVLGAAIELPATGSPTGWLILAITSIVLGLLLILRKKSMSKLLGFLTALVLATFLVSPASAAGTLSVRLESPKSPTREQNFNLTYTTLDLENRTPSVECFAQKPGESFVKFDSTKISTKPSGDSNTCKVTSSIVSSSGTYKFFVRVTAGEEVINSSQVEVVYDTDGPGTPGNFRKEHPSICRWVIKFQTAPDNGATQYVEIYSSKETNFNTDAGTRVGSVSIGSDQAGEFIHDRGSDCEEEWYYVIRAFDSAGNKSGHVGDKVVISSTTTTTTSESSSALIVGTDSSFVATGDLNGPGVSEAGEGDVLGKDDGEAGEESDNEEQDKGLIEGVKDAFSDPKNNNLRNWLIIAVLVLGIWRLYVSLKKSSK